MAVLQRENGRLVAVDLRFATNMINRARGLLGTNRLSPGSGLVIEPARQVHTIGMRYPIDVVFVAEDWTAVHIVQTMKPWRVTRWVRRSRRAVELPAGASADMEVGEKLVLRP